MALTYQRAWSREQERDARRFLIDHSERQSSDDVGCVPGTADRMWEAIDIADSNDTSVWVYGSDEEGVVRFVSVFKQFDPQTVAVLAFGTDPEYFTSQEFISLHYSYAGIFPQVTTVRALQPRDNLIPLRETIFGEGNVVFEGSPSFVQIGDESIEMGTLIVTVTPEYREAASAH